MIENLQQKLRELIKDYHYESDIIDDDDVDSFINTIIDYDHENNGAVYDCLQDNCNIVNYDVISDIINNFKTVEDISIFINDLDDATYENYILDDYGCLQNIRKQDLSDFIEDLDYAK